MIEHPKNTHILKPSVYETARLWSEPLSTLKVIKELMLVFDNATSYLYDVHTRFQEMALELLPSNFHLLHTQCFIPSASNLSLIHI